MTSIRVRDTGIAYRKRRKSVFLNRLNKQSLRRQDVLVVHFGLAIVKKITQLMDGKYRHQ
ncbi:hypothetical protein OK016_02400 [Vibrio chagasii]|nr:hypothetical protein [Vibrio chagasii]